MSKPITEAELVKLESRWNACHPANGEDDVHGLIAEVRRERKRAEAWKAAAERAEQLRAHWDGDCDPQLDCVQEANLLDNAFDAALEAARALDKGEA